MLYSFNIIMISPKVDDRNNYISHKQIIKLNEKNEEEEETEKNEQTNQIWDSSWDLSELVNS